MDAAHATLGSIAQPPYNRLVPVYGKFIEIHLFHMLHLLRLSDILLEEEEKQTWP